MIVTCRDLTESITDHKEGKLGAMDRAGFAFHLLWCDSCRTYIRQMDLTIATAKRLPRGEVPADVRAALRERFRRRGPRT